MVYTIRSIDRYTAEFRPPGVTRLPPLWGAARFYYSAAPSGVAQRGGLRKYLAHNAPSVRYLAYEN